MKGEATNYAEYGLDTTKRSQDEGKAGFRQCTWCGDQTVTRGFSMCFSNFCICPECVRLAFTLKDRWHTDPKNGCFKCERDNKGKVYGEMFFDIHDSLSICADCLRWAAEVLQIDNQIFSDTMNVAQIVQEAQNELAASLLKCRVEGNTVFLPPIEEGPLANYQDVRKALLNAGAKYKRNTFVFDSDAQPYIDRLVSGESVNLKKEFQFFPTPPDIAQIMVSYLPSVDADARVLEPSAGDGALIKAFRAAYPAIPVECFELMEINQKKLASIDGAVFLAADFMRVDELFDLCEAYDIILANPPFTNNQDIDHIYKMFALLKPGGTIITLASPSWTFGTSKKQEEFRAWLINLDTYPKPLPDQSFASSGTKITPVLLQIQKPKPITADSQPEEILDALEKSVTGVQTAIGDLRITVNEPFDIVPERKCRLCGCTDKDCRQCIEKTGQPCHWVAEDLCSACETRDEKIERLAEQPVEMVLIDPEGEHAQEPITTLAPVTKTADAYQEHVNKVLSQPKFEAMNFFAQLHKAGNGADLSIDIKEKNGKYTIMLLPKAGDKSRLQPLIMTGTPEELDAEFFPSVGPVLSESTMKLLNAEAFRKSVDAVADKDEKKKGNPPASAAPEKKEVAPKKGKSPTKAAAKKAAPRKAAQVPKVEESKPKVQEESLFD